MSPVLGMWTAMITILVGALLCFHIYLLAKGQTTNEYLRGEKRRGNVPHRSLVPNCKELWCGTQPDRSVLCAGGRGRLFSADPFSSFLLVPDALTAVSCCTAVCSTALTLFVCNGPQVVVVQWLQVLPLPHAAAGSGKGGCM